MDVLIPTRFYGFDSVMYIASAIIGFLVSYYAYKVFDVSGKRQHYLFYLSFVILSMGLLTLGLSSLNTYISYFVYNESGATPVDTIRYVDDFVYWIYYGCSIVAYAMLAFAYLPEKKEMLFPILLPFWYTGFPYFNIVSFFLLSYTIFRSALNFVDNKNLNTLFVMLAFALIGSYHMLLFFTSYSKIIYVIAHFCLSLGFLSLLIMLVRISNPLKLAKIGIGKATKKKIGRVRIF